MRLAVLRALGAAAALGAFAIALLSYRIVLWHDAIALPVVLGLAFVLVGTRHRGWALLAISTAALLIELTYLWEAGYAGRNHVFAGVFALSDAHGYYADAERVLHGAMMNSGGARRPLFSAVLAGVLAIVGNDIRLAHVVTLVFWTAAGTFAVCEVDRAKGRYAAGVLFVLFVLFARRYVGFVQSEGLGVPLGAIAFALLLRAERLAAGWQTTYLGGLLLQSIALYARPGPMLLVFAIVFWAVRRSTKEARPGILLRSAAVLLVSYAFQYGVRRATSGLASFTDVYPILYGLVHGEDSRFLVTHNPWLGTVPADELSATVLRLIAGEIAERPWLVVSAPLRCLLSWFYLPQGFFGFVWLNPDDRVLESSKAVRAATAESGMLGPVVLWVRTLGVYSLVNAVVMALSALAFVAALVRALGRSLRGRAWRAPNDLLFTAMAGILIELPLLPPWITEGAQILSTAFFYVVAFVAASVVPAVAPSLANEPPEVSPLPRVAPCAFVAIASLVFLAACFPVRLEQACGADGFLADVDRRSSVVYGADPTRATDRAANVAAIAKNNPNFAEDIAGTLATRQRIFTAYDGCRGALLYVLDGEGRDPLTRYMRLETRQMSQVPLETTLRPPRPN